MNAPRRKPERNETNAAWQARLRERRKALGYRRVSVWLSPEQAGQLETMGDDWLGRTVKQLLGDALAEPARKPQQAPLFPISVPDTGKAALWAEAESFRELGLSWGAIARRWNAQGRRTDKGAAFISGNQARDYRKWKGGNGE